VKQLYIIFNNYRFAISFPETEEGKEFAAKWMVMMLSHLTPFSNAATDFRVEGFAV
jgi:hypothetical protein